MAPEHGASTVGRKLETGNWRLEIRNSKIVHRFVTPAKAGVHAAMDSRLRGNDWLGEFRVSNCIQAGGF